jgi:hypothetical protein
VIVPTRIRKERDRGEYCTNIMRKKIIAGADFVPGWDKDQSSYRSKLTGMCGVIVCISLVVEYFEINQGKVEMTCDGIEALQVISE